MDVPLTRDVDGYGRPCSLRGHDLPSTSSPRNRRPDTNAPNNETTFIRILCSIHRRHILYILEEKKKRVRMHAIRARVASSGRKRFI